jgi:hypothetical protein
MGRAAKDQDYDRCHMVIGAATQNAFEVCALAICSQPTSSQPRSADDLTSLSILIGQRPRQTTTHTGTCSGHFVRLRGASFALTALAASHVRGRESAPPAPSRLIGLTNEDRMRRSEYLVKGAHPKARLKIKKKRVYQGRIYGKRCGTSEDIGSAARLRWAEAQGGIAEAIPFQA